MQLWMGSEIRLRCRGYLGHLRGQAFLYVDPGNICRVADHSIRGWSAASRIYLSKRQLRFTHCSVHSA